MASRTPTSWRRLNTHRIRAFRLDRLIDTFVSSCFIHRRKPDVGMFTLALDVAQAKARDVVYLENTPLFVDIAATLGIRGVLHENAAATETALARFGLS